MTLEEEKRLAVLAAIIYVGGTGTKARVLDAVEDLGLLRLTDSDKRVMRNRRELKSRNDLAFVRKHLVEERHVSDARHDNWMLTDSGRIYADTLARRAASSSGEYVNIKDTASVIEAALAPQIVDAAALSKETANEGATQLAWIVRYERDPRLRAAAIRHHGVACMACRSCSNSFPPSPRCSQLRRRTLPSSAGMSPLRQGRFNDAAGRTAPRAGDARQVLEAPIFIEARAHIERQLADLRRNVPISATDMHTRLILMEQLYGNLMAFFEQLVQTGKLVDIQLAQDRARQSLIQRGINAWKTSGRGGL